MACEPDPRLAGKSHVEEHVLGIGDLVAHFERRAIGVRRVGKAEPRQRERQRQRCAKLECPAAREKWEQGRGRGRSSLGERFADYATLPGMLARRFASSSTSSSVNTRLRVRKRTPSGASSEKPEPRPGTTSMISWVCFQ